MSLLSAVPATAVHVSLYDLLHDVLRWLPAVNS